MAINAVSGCPATPVQAPPQPQKDKVVSKDADGDNDASKTQKTEAKAVTPPPVSKPTETMGNKVNTYA